MSHPGSRPTTLRAEQVTIPAGHAWSRLPLIGGALGAIGLAASLALRAGAPEQFAFSWLVAFLYFLSLALGGLFFVLVHFVTGAKWSVVVRRLAENAMGTLPLFAVLFLPVALSLHELFHWTHADALAEDPLLAGKAGFLNTKFFLIRAVVYFAAWSALAYTFLSRSRRQDHSGDPRITRSLIRLSAPAMFVFAITVSFAAIDWLMSLDPHWYSTMFGVYYFSGCLVGFFGLIAILTVALRRAGLLGDAVTIEHLHDLGKLLFAFTVFWAYIAFSQYFLIWYANIPEETVWYLHRAEGSWKTVSLMLGWGHFAVPFFFLMPRTIKRRPALLVLGSAWMLFMHLVDLYWLVMPTLHPHGVHLTWLDLTSLLAVGGLFLGAMGWMMRRHALVPHRDPRLGTSLGFENI